MYGLSDEAFLEFLLCRALNFQYALHTTQEEKQPLSISEVRKAGVQDTRVSEAIREMRLFQEAPSEILRRNSFPASPNTRCSSVSLKNKRGWMTMETVFQRTKKYFPRQCPDPV